MSYRNPGQLVTKYNPTDGVIKQNSVEKPNYNEIARKNAKANFDIVRQNDMNAQKAFADYSKVVKETPYINQASANSILSDSIDEYAAAKSRLETATGFYEKIDEETGDVLYSYDNDLKILANNQAFLNGFSQDLSAINYMTEEFDKSGGFGSGEGQVDAMFTSPYFTLLKSVQDPFAEGVNVEYIKEKDANGIPSLGIKLYGSRVAEVNKTLGNEGDSYVIKPGELQKILNNQDGDPSFVGLYYKNHTAIGDIKQQTESIGIIDPKTGLISKEYMVDGGVTTKTNTIGGYTEQISTSVVNRDKVNQTFNPIIKAQVDSIMRRGDTSTDVAINQYAQQDEDGNYYYNPVTWDAVNNKFSIDKQNPVILGKDFFDRNLTEENQKTFGYTQEQYNHVVEILKSNIYQDLGFTQQPQQTIIPGTRKDIPKQTKPTEGEIKRNNAIELTAKGVNSLSKLTSNELKDINKVQAALSPIANLFGGEIQLIDDKIVLTNFYKEDSKGNVSISDKSQEIDISNLTGLEAQKKVMQELLNIGFDVNVLDYSQQQIDKLVGGYKFDPSTVSSEIDNLMKKLVTADGKLKSEEEVEGIIKDTYGEVLDIEQTGFGTDALIIGSTKISSENYTSDALREALEIELYGQTQDANAPLSNIENKTGGISR